MTKSNWAEEYGKVNGWYLFAKQDDGTFVTVGEDVKAYLQSEINKAENLSYKKGYEDGKSLQNRQG